MSYLVNYTEHINHTVRVAGETRAEALENFWLIWHEAGADGFKSVEYESPGPQAVYVWEDT